MSSVTFCRVVDRFVDVSVAFVAAAMLVIVLLLSGCGQVTQAQADNANAQVQGLCGTAMSLAPLAGPMSVDIIAACGTAEVVADLATKPGAVAYLNTLIAKVPH